MNFCNSILCQVIILFLFSHTVWAGDDRFIQIQTIDGRSWLVDGQGQPFFAHGVTHVNNKQHGIDVKIIGQACQELGFNAYGYGCPIPLKEEFPYVEGRQMVPMSMYRTTDDSFGYVDIFDPQEQSRLKQQVIQLCLANRDNPNLIGYCWTDLGAWPLKNSTGTNWVEYIRALPEETPGHKTYLEFVESWQGDDPNERDQAFLQLIAREYFRVLGETNNRYDPNHLIFGDRFTFDTAVPEVVTEMLPYVDAIAIQPPFRPGFPRAQYERIHKMTGKPIIICDFAIRFRDGDKKIRGWKPEQNAAIAGTRYEQYVRDAIATPYILGTFWCNPIDSKPGFNKTGIKQGLFDQGLTPRPELNRAIVDLNAYLKQQTP